MANAQQQHCSAQLNESHADLLARPDPLKALRSCRLQSLAVGFVLEPVLHAPHTASQSEVDVIASSCIMVWGTELLQHGYERQGVPS